MRRKTILGALCAALIAGMPPQLAAHDATITEAPAGTSVTNLSAYFEAGSGELGSSGIALIEYMTKQYLADPATRIHLVGHDDTSRPADEAILMSKLRTLAVANILKDLGVDESRITMAYFGENQLAKPTLDGVSEPLNRRVEMTVITPE